MLAKAQLLRLLRESSGLTQQEVAVKKKISPSYLSLVESGKKIPSNELLEKLADLYKIPAYLLAWDEKNLERTATPKERELLKKINSFLEQLFFLVVNRK